MGFSVNTNVDALNTYSNLTKVQNSLSSSLAKLSSGLRINNAGDDAAGMTIATSLASQVSGLTQASRNAQDGTSVVQTADGALSQAQSLLQRLRDLAVQAANDSNSSSARTAISTEATSITSELSRLGQSVNFNGKNLLDGTAGTLNFQVGADGNSQSQIGVNLSSANLVSTANSLASGGTGYTIATAKFATTSTGSSAVITSTTSGRTTTATVAIPAIATTSPAQTSLQQAQTVASTLNANTDFQSDFTASIYSADSGVTWKVAVVAKDGGTITATTDVATSGTQADASPASVATIGKLQFDTAANAQASITAIDAQLNAVSTARANIGALENRFSSAVSTLSTSITNITAAKSRITDVDMASEMVNYSRANILSQSGTAMLAQANSLPQLALKLLQG